MATIRARRQADGTTRYTAIIQGDFCPPNLNTRQQVAVGIEMLKAC